MAEKFSSQHKVQGSLKSLIQKRPSVVTKKKSHHFPSCIKCTSCGKAVMFNRHWSKGVSHEAVTVVGSMYYQRMFNWEITILMDAILVQF